MAAVDGWQGQGGHLVFVTLTVRHRSGDPLAKTLDAVISGFRHLQKGRPWLSFKRRFGIRGVIRATEITLGENGWHPHIHALFFVDKPLSPSDIHAWESEMFERWAAIVTRLGARLPTQLRGIDVRLADAQGTVVGQYLAKLQEVGEGKRYTVGSELARSDLKAGRAASMMPFELLDPVSRQDDIDDQAAWQLWCEYVEVTRGRRAITWSRGLRELCQIEDAERTDEEILDDVQSAPVVFLVPGHAYDRIRSQPDVLAHALALVDRGQISLAMRLTGGVSPPDLVDCRTGELRQVGT